MRFYFLFKHGFSGIRNRKLMGRISESLLVHELAGNQGKAATNLQEVKLNKACKIVLQLQLPSWMEFAAIMFKQRVAVGFACYKVAKAL